MGFKGLSIMRGVGFNGFLGLWFRDLLLPSLGDNAN